MANIHRIGDYSNDNEANRMYPGGQRQMRMGGGLMGNPNPQSQEDLRNLPFVNAYSRDQGDPRNENFWSMLKIYF